MTLTENYYPKKRSNLGGVSCCVIKWIPKMECFIDVFLSLKVRGLSPDFYQPHTNSNIIYSNKDIWLKVAQ